MKDLKQYDNTTVRIRTTFGEVLEGPCEWNDKEYCLSEYGIDDDCLVIPEYTYISGGIDVIKTMIPVGIIETVELLRPEAIIPVRDWPEAKEEIAAWFASKWSVPLEAYRESIRECLGEEEGVPQWYVAVRGNRIVAGCGVIENDFHKRTDLTPNVCAVYVEEDCRRQGVAGFLLKTVCRDMAAMGYKTLYLLTDHIGFYERYGWEFFCMAENDDGSESRMYVHREE